MGAAWRDTIGKKTNFNQILEYIKEIRGIGMEVCCTLDMLEQKLAEQLKTADLTAYNHNLDTSRDINDMHPRTRKIMQLLRVKQIFNGVFMKVIEVTMIRRVFCEIDTFPFDEPLEDCGVEIYLCKPVRLSRASESEIQRWVIRLQGARRRRLRPKVTARVRVASQVQGNPPSQGLSCKKTNLSLQNRTKILVQFHCSRSRVFHYNLSNELLLFKRHDQVCVSTTHQ